MARPDVAEPFEHLEFGISYIYFIILWPTELQAWQNIRDMGRRDSAGGPIAPELCPRVHRQCLKKEGGPCARDLLGFLFFINHTH